MTRVVSILVLCAIFAFTASKKIKKLEETISFDVKPSGQISHQKIKLVGRTGDINSE